MSAHAKTAEPDVTSDLDAAREGMQDILDELVTKGGQGTELVNRPAGVLALLDRGDLGRARAALRATIEWVTVQPNGRGSLLAADLVAVLALLDCAVQDVELGQL